MQTAILAGLPVFAIIKFILRAAPYPTLSAVSNPKLSHSLPKISRDIDT
jgi:hypothetical protein